jgi:cysteine desulfurase / selenocysteine lyase
MGAEQLERLRSEEFPITEAWCYLDHASRGPLPTSHVRDVTEYLAQTMRSGESLVYQTADKMNEIRSLAATLLNARALDIALLTSTGHGVGLVAQGLDWNEGDEVITYAREFPGVVLPWLQLEEKGIAVRFLPDRGGRWEVSDLAALLSERTRTVALSLVNWETGFRGPVEEVAELCRPRGVWLVVDAAQALGSIEVDSKALGADVITAQAYKHLLGGFGISVCFCSPRARAELSAAGAGWAGRDRDDIGANDYRIPLSADARRFETSHPSAASVRGFLASLRLLLANSPSQYQAHIMTLADELIEGLEQRAWTIVSPRTPRERSSIISATKEGIDLSALRETLNTKRIACSVRDDRLRLSPHLYNTSEDLEYLFQVIDDSLPRT